MRVRLLAWGALALACTALAAEPDAAAVATKPAGYAFAYPRLLAQQRLYGIAHGVALLAKACLNADENADDTARAYRTWLVSQQGVIDAATLELAGYYRISPATDGAALAQVMNLQTALAHAPGSAELKAACATLPQALAQPRYDLTERLRMEELMHHLMANAEVDARNAHCRPLFSEPMRKLHDARLAVWQEINAPLVTHARAVLERDWPAGAPAASFAAWQDDMRKHMKVDGRLAECEEFSAALKRPEAALRNVFSLPPATPK